MPRLKTRWLYITNEFSASELSMGHYSFERFPTVGEEQSSFLAALQPYMRSCPIQGRKGKKFISFICLVIKTEVAQYVFRMYI